MPLTGVPKETLYTLVPHGQVATRKWLLEQGVGTHAVDNLIKSGQLLAASRGVYKRPDTSLEWQGVVASLERMNYPLIVGGLTALDINGYGHYVSPSDKTVVHLYGLMPQPTWLNKLNCGRKFVTHSTTKLFDSELQASTIIQPSVVMGSRQSRPAFNICAPDTAYLQVLMDVPKAVSFEFADQLMEGLSNLSPKRLDKLLRHCKSVKVKRLFFWFAERHTHPWFAKLNSRDYKLGTGKRMLVKGGKLDLRYNITVPGNMQGPSQPIY